MSTFHPTQFDGSTRTRALRHEPCSVAHCASVALNLVLLAVLALSLTLTCRPVAAQGAVFGGNRGAEGVWRPRSPSTPRPRLAIDAPDALDAPSNSESPSRGQRLPPIGANTANDENPVLRMAERPNYLPVPLPQDDPPGAPYFIPPAIEDDQLLVGGPKLSAFKQGFFQKASLGATWLPKDGSNGLGIVESEAFVTVAVPAPTKEWPMLITPYINIRSLNGPTNPDLPPELYETYVDFMWVPRLAPRLLGIIAVTPSFYSDFQHGDSDGFRLQGKGLARWDIVPEELQLMLGILYLNREDIRVLPAGGLIWKPNDNINYEMLFPRPKLAHRFRFTETWEDWFYLAGEFGGNSFDILRADGSRDIATLRDLRVMLGVERKKNGGAGARFEVGYVFNRSVEYLSGTPDFDPNNTLLLRLVGTF